MMMMRVPTNMPETHGRIDLVRHCGTLDDTGAFVSQMADATVDRKVQHG